MNMVAIDSAGAAGCPIDGANPDPWIAKHLGAYLRTGCGVVVTDHLPKSPQKRAESPGPVGSGQKLARADVPLAMGGECWAPGEDGYITLRPEKDKLGIFPRGTQMAAAVIRGTWREGALGITILPPQAKTEELGDVVLEVVEAHPDGLSTRQLRAEVRKTVRARDVDIGKVAAKLAEDGLIQREQNGRSVMYRPFGSEEWGDILAGTIENGLYAGVSSNGSQPAPLGGIRGNHRGV